VGRYNAPDALLALLLVSAAWSLTVAVQSGRLRALLLCATLLGLAFNTKMLEAYLVAPALALFLPWLKWVVIACGAVAGAMVLAPYLRRARGGTAGARCGTATLGVSIGAAAVALLAGPASYSLATVTRDHTGYDPAAGPSSRSSLRRRERALIIAGSAAASLEPAQFASGLVSITRYLRKHRAGARFLVAATDAKTAAPIALASGQPVITIGGFAGSDPTPTAGQLERLISSRRLRYVLLDASRVMPASAAQRPSSAPAWVERHCVRVPPASIVASATSGAPRLQAQISPKLALYGGCV
jgi:4-amino-4-deoxy-L-arabinose transferase-like glycosyltransferase